MQSDMHFYCVYAIARVAGFAPSQARKVATAAEFVDWAAAVEPVLVNGQTALLPVVTSQRMHMEPGKRSVMDQWRVWLPFHFLPGGYGKGAWAKSVCAWGESDNVAAASIIGMVLDQRQQRHDLHLLGLAAHVIQDTYAHYGFSGIAAKGNGVRASSLHSDVQGFDEMLERCPETAIHGQGGETRLGHEAVSICPDLPYLVWRFRFEKYPELPVRYDLENRDNRHSFYLSCTRLHALFRAFLNGETAIGEPDGHAVFSPAVESVLRELIGFERPRVEDRCALWRERITKGELFPIAPEDRGLMYDPTGWDYSVMHNNAVAATTDAYQFNQAAALYLDHVHGEVLPALGILSY